MEAVDIHQATELVAAHQRRDDLLRLGRSKRNLTIHEFEGWLDQTEAAFGLSDIEITIIYEGYDGDA